MSDAPGEGADRTQEIRIALLTNFVAPYRVPVFHALAARVRHLLILVSTPMEGGRNWQPESGGLDVRVQRSFTRKRVWQHPRGFEEILYTHFPYDTVPALSAFRPDAVISGEFGFRTLNAVLHRALWRRTKLVIWATLSEYTEEKRGRLRETLRRFLIRHADAVMVNGRSGATYVQRYGVPQSKIFEVPQTTDVQAFGEVKLERDSSAAYRLLFVGRLVELKRVKPFLEILAKWAVDHPEINVEFWIAGEGPERTAIESVVIPQNLKLRLLGEFPYAQLPAVYAEAGILVFPTMADEWGLVVNEGMAAGLPVLGSLYGQAVEEMVEEGRTGWVFRAEDQQSIYSKISARLCDHPGELAGDARSGEANGFSENAAAHGGGYVGRSPLRDGQGLTSMSFVSEPYS